MAIKTGYARIVGRFAGTFSFSEILSWNSEALDMLRHCLDSGESSLFCACNEENVLPLMITSNHVIRVKENLKQEQHLQSCPKSEHYKKWLAENAPGTYVSPYAEDTVMFYLRLPSIVKNPSSGSSSSTSGKSGKSETPHTKLYDMVRTLNFMAWEKQTFSKKKELALARREKRQPDKNYKSFEDFNKLFFGNTHNVHVMMGSEVIPFYDFCYKKSTFYHPDNRNGRFFMYAEIEKFSEYKEDRKYQYITVKMPSNKSAYRAVVRVPTEDYDKLLEESGIETKIPGTHRMLAGYICRSYFSNKDGSSSDWITLLKGIAFYVSENGLYVENERIARITNHLANRGVLFMRPYKPLQSYGNFMPTFLFERYKRNNLIIDLVCSSREYNQRTLLKADNPEFDIHIFKDDEEPDMDWFIQTEL